VRIGRRARARFNKLVHVAVLATFSILLAFPFYWMLITSFKKTTDLYNLKNNPFIFNEPPTLDHVKLLFRETLFLRWFAGSFGLHPTVPERMRDRIEVVEGVPLNQFEPDWLGERVAHQTLLVHDESDKVSPLASSHRIVRALPNAALHTTNGLGHARILGDPAVAVRVLRHLLPTVR